MYSRPPPAGGAFDSILMYSLSNNLSHPHPPSLETPPRNPNALLHLAIPNHKLPPPFPFPSSIPVNIRKCPPSPLKLASRLGFERPREPANRGRRAVRLDAVDGAQHEFRPEVGGDVVAHFALDEGGGFLLGLFAGERKGQFVILERRCSTM